MADRDAHVRGVKKLTDTIRNSPDPDTRNKASEDLKVKWTTYNRNKGGS